MVGLQVALDGPPPPEQIAPNLWVLTGTTFDVPSHWREWLGSIRANQVGDTDLFLVSKLASEMPGVLDGENQSLQQRVEHFYAGLLLSKMFSPSHSPFMLTGARSDGAIAVRQHIDLELPMPQICRPYPGIVADDIAMAAQLGQKLDLMVLEPVPDDRRRFFRTLNIYIKARTTRNPLDRIHQYCRCIEGLILPTIGRTKRQFKSRTALFIGPAHHELMGALYDIRSDVEHLHEGRHLETLNRQVRFSLAKKEAIVEYIARRALARIINQNGLWQHFGNAAALREFWALLPDKRQEIWGDFIDPKVPVEDLDPNDVSDEMLGAREF